MTPASQAAPRMSLTGSTEATLLQELRDARRALAGTAELARPLPGAAQSRHAYVNVGPERVLSCVMQLLCIKPAWPGVCAFPTAAQVPALSIVCLAACICPPLCAGALWPMPAWVWRDVRSVFILFTHICIYTSTRRGLGLVGCEVPGRVSSAKGRRAVDAPSPHLHRSHTVLTIQPLKACLASRRDSFVRPLVLALCSLVELDAACRRVGGGCCSGNRQPLLKSMWLEPRLRSGCRRAYGHNHTMNTCSVQWPEDVIKADPFFGRLDSGVWFRVPPWVTNTIARDHLA